MEKLDSNSVRLATQLRQVIQADRMAVDMVNGAYETKRAIEQKTADEKKKILQEAEEKRQEALERVAAEQREELAKRKERAAQQYAGARQALAGEMDQNRAAWAAEIAGRIIGAQQG